MKKLFTSESVTCGHPDKICDQIADAILDEYLRCDENARVAVEVCASTNLVVIMGEITSTSTVDIEDIARKTIINIGYNSEELGFNGNTCKIIQNMNKQSSDIALGVDASLEEKEYSHEHELGAGDQGLMFGYASDETTVYMPLAISLAHQLSKRLEYVRKKDILSYLRPDGKTQVTIEYDDDLSKRVDTIVISCQHEPTAEMTELRKDIILNVIKEVIPENLIDNETKILINPTGKFVIGGPACDSGLTGRKIIVDTYGGYAHHGGGSFSGKDYTKVDRTASYYARYVSKNIVASGVAHKCEIQVSYAIGVATPVSINVNTFGTSVIPEDKILFIIKKVFDFRPSKMIESLHLKEPIYHNYSAYGHFGREEIDTPWERLDKVEIIKRMIQTTK